MLTNTTRPNGTHTIPRRADNGTGWVAWHSIAWHSKVRIAVLTVALFMALC